MKKILIFAAVLAVTLTGCKNKNDNSGPQMTEQTSLSEQNTMQVPEETEKNNNSISFDNINTDDNNPIDKALSSALDEADTTLKINKASEDFYNAWKNEISNAANLCKQNGVSGYSEDEYNTIETKAQKAYDTELELSGGGSSAIGSAMYKAGEIYKQGTYYYISLYKQHSGKEYVYSYK